MKKLTTKEFIKKSKLIHGNKYDYNLVDYINNRTNVKILCEKHGVFKQIAKTHLNGGGCTQCNKNIPTNDEFILKLKENITGNFNCDNIVP